ncbi:hypothetical protein FDECE_872 [Fusarium decemcellulare]|nr:hypothetical protein FDECE_872 [Fusarium decemcellulare]
MIKLALEADPFDVVNLSFQVFPLVTNGDLSDQELNRPYRQVVADTSGAVGLSPTEYQKCFEAAVKTLHKYNLFGTESFTKWSGYRSIKRFTDEAKEAHGHQPTDTVGPPYLVMSATAMISTIALDKKIGVDITNNSTVSVPEQMDNGTWLVPSPMVKHFPFFDEIDEFFSYYSSEPDADGDSMESEADDDLSEPEPDSDDNHPEPDNAHSFQYQKLTDPDAYEMIRTEHDEVYRELMDAAIVTVDIVCVTPVAFAEFANNSSWGPDLIIIDEAARLCEVNERLRGLLTPSGRLLYIGRVKSSIVPT